MIAYLKLVHTFLSIFIARTGRRAAPRSPFGNWRRTSVFVGLLHALLCDSEAATSNSADESLVEQIFACARTDRKGYFIQIGEVCISFTFRRVERLKRLDLFVSHNGLPFSP